MPHVRVVHGGGTRVMCEPADVIYVNAGATRPADAWLDRLKERGRLILPLTADGFPNRDVRRGGVFRIERCGPELFARRISGVAIFPCESGHDEASQQVLATAFDKGDTERVILHPAGPGRGGGPRCRTPVSARRRYGAMIRGSWH